MNRTELAQNVFRDVFFETFNKTNYSGLDNPDSYTIRAMIIYGNKIGLTVKEEKDKELKAIVEKHNESFIYKQYGNAIQLYSANQRLQARIEELEKQLKEHENNPACQRQREGAQAQPSETSNIG